MSRLVEREPSEGTLYPVEIPGHVHPRHRIGRKDRVQLYFTIEQLTKLRAAVAAAIVKANKHRVESK